MNTLLLIIGLALATLIILFIAIQLFFGTTKKWHDKDLQAP